MNATKDKNGNVHFDFTVKHFCKNSQEFSNKVANEFVAFVDLFKHFKKFSVV